MSLAHKDLKALWAIQVPKDLKVFKEIWDHKVHKVSWAILVPKDHKDHKVFKEIWDHKVHKVSWAILVPKDHKDHKESPALKARKEVREILDHRASLDHKDQLVLQGL